MTTGRKTFIHSRKTFAEMRKRAKKPEILKSLLEMAHNGATYMELYNTLRIPGAPNIHSEHVASYVASICPEVAKVKRIQTQKEREQKKALLHQAAWMASHGLYTKDVAEMFHVSYSVLIKKLQYLHCIAYRRVKCLRCGRMFWSWNPKLNRICPRHKKEETIYSPYEWGVGRILIEEEKGGD